jgi:hypothetical protein
VEPARAVGASRSRTPCAASPGAGWLRQAVAPLATKAELELWGGALLARIDRTHQQLQIDLARHANALHESMATMIRAIDDKYTDLPGRVGRLESVVFTPKPR